MRLHKYFGYVPSWCKWFHLLLGRCFAIMFSVCPQEAFKTITQTHIQLHTMDQGAPLKDISIDMEISEEEEDVSSLLEQREINPTDTPGVTEEHTKGQDPLATHSNTKALIKDRDPKGINKCLKVSHTINTVQTNGLLLFSGFSDIYVCTKWEVYPDWWCSEIYVTLDHKKVLTRWGIFVAIAKNTFNGVQRVNMHCYELHLDNFKGDFLSIVIFYSNSDIQIVSRQNIVRSQPYINGKHIYNLNTITIYKTHVTCHNTLMKMNHDFTTKIKNMVTIVKPW